MAGLSIGAVAQRVGLRTSALRYYESIDLLPAPQRVNGRRVYDETIVQRVALIQMAQNAGFTIAEIKIFLHGFTPETPPSVRWRAMAQQKQEELEAMITRAQAMKTILALGLQCECLRLEDCRVINEAGYHQAARAPACAS